MELIDKLNEDLKTALKNNDEVAKNTIRMIKSALSYKKIELNRELEEGEIFQVIKKEAKKREEAIEEYKKGNREELVEKEAKELEIIKRYLPQMLTEVEIEDEIKKVIQETGASSKKDIGKVMKAVMEKLKGRADGKTVSQIANRILT